MSLTPIFRTAEIRDIEARYDEKRPPLMERAGLALAAVAETMLGGRKAANQAILIIAGPGNNGGDGFVAARHLRERGHWVQVVFCGTIDQLPPDASTAMATWQASGGNWLSDIPAGNFALTIDALFGVGLSKPVSGHLATMIQRINDLRCPVLSVDIPSGLCADTGKVLGVAVRATRTLSFIGGKPGLFTFDGPDHCGEVSVDGLGLHGHKPHGHVVHRDLFQHYLHPRVKNTHKGSYGDVVVVGGAAGMSGAALMAGRAALKLGAGRVFVDLLEPLPVDPVQPELMLRSQGEALPFASVLAVGPGLGQSPTAIERLQQAIATSLPLVLDADALNILAREPRVFELLSARNAATVLTPHPTEAARLLGRETSEIQADRLAAAETLARLSKAYVVLKGSGSIIAGPDGHWFINNTGSPGLATAGTGDVLTGFVAALLAQSWPAREALLAACHLHGEAAEALVVCGKGPVGLTAGELIDSARTIFNRWLVHA